MGTRPAEALSEVRLAPGLHRTTVPFLLKAMASLSPGGASAIRGRDLLSGQLSTSKAREFLQLSQPRARELQVTAVTSTLAQLLAGCPALTEASEPPL